MKLTSSDTEPRLRAWFFILPAKHNPSNKKHFHCIIINKSVHDILFFHYSAITIALFPFSPVKRLRALPLCGIFISKQHYKATGLTEKVMCSIFGVLDIKTDAGELRKKALELSRLMRHRGPDWSGVYASDKAILAHERLSIVDVNAGAQPLYNEKKRTRWLSTVKSTTTRRCAPNTATATRSRPVLTVK
jgi:asparagine synthase (glutamine-hydrolysing)